MQRSSSENEGGWYSQLYSSRLVVLQLLVFELGLHIPCFQEYQEVLFAARSTLTQIDANWHTQTAQSNCIPNCTPNGCMHNSAARTTRLHTRLDCIHNRPEASLLRCFDASILRALGCRHVYALSPHVTQTLALADVVGKPGHSCCQ